MKTLELHTPSPVTSEINGVLHGCRAEHLGVVRTAREYRLVAIQPIAIGEVLFRIQGEVTDRPTRYSVQIGENQHIDLGSNHSAEEILDRYFWRFMNHSCEPNAIICDREVIALREILPWEAVTFNYNTNEWEMAEPFDCMCGTSRCMGKIQGLRHLTPEQREQLGRVAPHLSRYVFSQVGQTAESSQA